MFCQLEFENDTADGEPYVIVVPVFTGQAEIGNLETKLGIRFDPRSVGDV